MIFKKIIAYSLSVCFIISAFGFTVNFMCFNHSFYEYEYMRLNTAESIGMSKEDLNLTTDVLLAYLKGDNDDLKVEVKINGEKREVFNTKEKTHMVDVLKLYQNFNFVYHSAALLLVIFIALALFKRIAITDLIKSYQKILLFIAGLVAAVAIYCMIDFNAFWTNFHHIFFSNDLWLLDPRQDILIQMVPGPFFNDLVLAIITLFIMILVIYYILLTLVKRRLAHV